ncbi:MAG: 4-hydroxythreonine-4-phosphate dehydrogenase PdxA [Candidatus Omnitrophota bacterium]
MSAKRVVITTGDPAGCGPYITMKAIYALRHVKADFFVAADKHVLQNTALYHALTGRITLIDAHTPGIERLEIGKVSLLGATASLSYLDQGLKAMQCLGIDRLVTAPVSKEAVKLVLPGFCGHTEYLARHFRVKNFAMMMASRKLKVVLFSRHLPLREVSGEIRKKELLDTFSLVYSSLKENFKIKNPAMAVCALNPHAGISTFMEKEERAVYEAVKAFSGRMHGPFPADTIFIPQNLKKYDCIITLYHDQGMIPFKLLSLKEGVNVTVGLPIIRTSPDHGVAYDVVKENKIPFASSMIAAIKLALELSV